MVLYFSGTGNSQFAALQIGELIKDEVVSINHYLKTGQRASFQTERPLLFVTPTYSWRIPRVVERWILETEFQGSQDAYFIMTCAGGCGDAASYLRSLCAKKGLRFRGVSAVFMPENYLALFPTPDEAECKAVIESAGPRIAGIAKQILAGAQLPDMPVSFGDKLKSGPVNPLFYALFVHDQGFKAGSACVSCGKCAKNCPLNNIDLLDGKPVWKGNCTHCMACIGGCPTEAIEYKANSRGRHRHYIKKDARC